MRAVVLNCTLKRSPEPSNTERLASVLVAAFERAQVATTTIRVVDHHVRPGVTSDIGFTVPGQAWTYWNMGPGPGPSYTDTDHGHAWSQRTGETAAANLLAVARALQAHPMPAPPSGG